mgnify:CR=1 FL=1
MATVTMAVGAILTLLGIGGYVLTQMASLTALIPAAFGLVFLALGAWGRQESARKHAMHGAMALAILGILGSARGVMQLPSYLSGGEVARPAAMISQSVMAVTLLLFLAMGIRSFIAARR